LIVLVAICSGLSLVCPDRAWSTAVARTHAGSHPTTTEEELVTMRMTRRRFLGASTGLAAGLTLSPLLARAGGSPMIPAWTTSAPPVPGLGYLTTLAVDPSTSSTLLAGGDVHGLKRTTDAGHLWEQIDTGTWKAGRYGIAAIAPHPNTPGKYYVLSGSDSSHGGVYVTTNYGDDWRLLAIDIVTQPQTGSINGQPVLRVYGRLLALDASGRHDVLYAASYSDGLYKSTDGGATWTNIAFAKENKNLTAVVLHPTVPSTVYVGWRANTTNWSDTTGGIKVSTDGGQHWSDLLTGVPVRDLVIDPNQTTSIYVAALTGGVYRSLKGIWSHPNTGLPLTTPQGAPTYFNAIEVNPNKLGHVLVGTGEGNTNATNGSVYSSLDRAGSWTNLVTSTNVHIDDTVIVPSFYYLGGNGDAISAVAVPKPPPNQPPPPLSSTTIWVSGRSLAWYSPDGGANWFPSSAGLEGAGRHFDVAVDPATGSLYMGTGDWVLIRSDAARQVFELVPLSFPQGEVRSLCFAFTTTRLLLGAGSSKDVSANNWGGVFRSPADGQPASTRGTSWSLVGGLPSARVVGLAAAPSKPDVVYAAVAKNGVYKSTDGGTTFAAMSASGLPNPTTLFPGSFTKVPIAVHPAEPNAVYLLDHVHGLFAYSPSAGTWTNVSGAVPITGTPVDANAPYQGFALDPLQPSRLYLATSAGLFRSVDAGAKWTQVQIANTESFGPVVADPRTGAVFASTALPDESSALTDKPGIYVSTDGGNSWVGAYVDGRFAVNFDALAIDPTTMKPPMLWAASAGSLFSLALS
jgi:hypothetical protein